MSSRQRPTTPATTEHHATATLRVLHEQLSIEPHAEQVGAVRVRIEVDKVPRTVDTPSVTQRVEVERVPHDLVVDGMAPPRFEDGVLVVPVYEERIVRLCVLKEEIRLVTHAELQPDTQTTVVRRERAVVERQRADGSWHPIVDEARTGNKPVGSDTVVAASAANSRKEAIMKQTVVGVFNRYEAARHATELLQDSGFGPDSVHITAESGASIAPSTSGEEGGMLEGVRRFFAGIFGPSDDDTEVSQYAEVVRRGGAIVTVDADDDPAVALACSALESAGAVDIENEADDGAAASDSAAVDKTRSTAKGAGPEEVIPVVKEEMEVGKRAVSTGAVRVYARTVEHPVTESVELREEHARVERRPVDRPATEADLGAFEDRTIEVKEMAEKAVVQKSARVVEEVVVGKDMSSRTESIQDKVRDTEVKVERAGGDESSTRGKYEDYESDFRADHLTAYANTGTYEDYDPAYRYGYTLASDKHHAGRKWEDIETAARADWEQRNPNSPWDRFKGAVKHAWQRVTGEA